MVHDLDRMYTHAQLQNNGTLHNSMTPSLVTPRLPGTGYPSPTALASSDNTTLCHLTAAGQAIRQTTALQPEKMTGHFVCTVNQHRFSVYSNGSAKTLVGMVNFFFP